MGDRVARWLRGLLAARRRRRRALRAAAFAATDRRIARAEHDLREIEARLDLLDIQADVRREP